MVLHKESLTTLLGLVFTAERSLNPVVNTAGRTAGHCTAQATGTDNCRPTEHCRARHRATNLQILESFLGEDKPVLMKIEIKTRLGILFYSIRIEVSFNC